MNMRNGDFVCEKCIEEPALQKVVRAHLSSRHCDYCEATSTIPIACDLDHVLRRIKYAVNEEYTDPVSKLPYDGREGGYQGPVIDDSCDLFGQMNLCVENSDLLDDLQSEFDGELYVSRNVLGPTSEEFFADAWQRFKRVVQHQRRYTFWNSTEQGNHTNPAGGVAVGETLSVIAQSIEQLAPVAVLPIGTELWRVQVFDKGKSSYDPSRYTSPPDEKANQPNRMSPAGISMLYVAEDFNTAREESIAPEVDATRETTGVRFRTLIPLNILDLSQFYFRRSYFSELNRDARSAVDFLTAFTREVSRPIKRDERQYVEYVPTQVFTEYVRFELQTKEAEPFQGIKYLSSKNRHACFVLFADQKDCLPTSTSTPPKRQMVQFVDGSFLTQSVQ